MSKTAIITGAAGALAQAVIEVFKEAGYQLVLVIHQESEKTRLEQEQPGALVVQADLGSEAEAKEAVKQVLKRFGRVDVLLNLAGGFATSAAAETSAEDMKLQLTLNLWTVFNSTRAVLPAMLEQASGFILGVGSGAAQQGGAKQGPYAASKAAMIAYLKSVRAELQPKGIGVAILHPMSAIDTPGNRKAMPNGKPEKWLDPRALAETMLHLVSRGARGQIFEVMVYPGGG